MRPHRKSAALTLTLLMLMLPASASGLAGAAPFVPPAPGTYRLETISQAPPGRVLDSGGRLHPLSRYVRGRVTLLGFIYTYCTDPQACPLAYRTFAELHARLARVPTLASQVRLVSLSFDPVNDTPAMMRAYGGAYLDGPSCVPWHFLTTRSVAELKPMIDGLGQAVAVQRDAAGRPTRLYNHMLKVFLFDRYGRVREIYSTAYLQPDV
ncbi:MAG TPA: SCO family protein, partial [Burkholderiaceae bacterium]